jgi:thioesterase domain-containing protein
VVTATGDVTELRRDYAAFVRQVLAGSGDPSRIALDVFNTPVDPRSPRDAIAAEVLANPLNRIGPLVHAAGPSTGRPAYLVHGVDGETSWFLRHLRGARMPRPVYGLTAPGWYGEPTPDSCERLAASHLAHVRAHQPVGPYTLGGYSGGGFVAMEMARQLEIAGSRADLVVVADPALAAEEMSRHDITVFRLLQLRRRRHPVMAPYFDLADRLDVAAAIDMTWGERVPADPVERRFARGLDILDRLTRARPRPAFAPVSAAGLIVLTAGSADAGESEFDAMIARLAASFGGGAEIVTIDELHNRLFENGAFQQLLGRRLG